MLSKPLTLAPSLFNFFIPPEPGQSLGRGGMLGTKDPPVCLTLTFVWRLTAAGRHRLPKTEGEEGC